MAVLKGADLVSKEIATTGHWELQYPNQLLEIAGEAARRGIRRLPEVGTFVDIGANLGFYSLLFAQHGYRVLAVEPMLLNRKAIQASLCANPVLAGRVQLLPLALGAPGAERHRCVVRADDRNAGNGKLFCSPDERCEAVPSAASRRGSLSTSQAHRLADAQAHSTICEPVHLSTLDELLRQQAGLLSVYPLVAAKLDVEGFECNVLAGGRSLLGAPHRTPVIVAEANRKPVKQCLSKAAGEFGYRWAVTQPVHSGGLLGDTNWILVSQPSDHSSAVAGGAAGGAAGGDAGVDAVGARTRAAGSVPAADGKACTWANGCCVRHKSLPACRHAKPGGAGGQSHHVHHGHSHSG